jgi:hypothetical protein
MRAWLTTLAILAGAGAGAGILGLAPPAQAQNLPWCAHLDYGTDEAVNCTFTSFEQCRSEIHGVGGFCMANNTYQAPAVPSHRAKKHTPLKPS